MHRFYPPAALRPSYLRGLGGSGGLAACSRTTSPRPGHHHCHHHHCPRRRRRHCLRHSLRRVHRMGMRHRPARTVNRPTTIPTTMPPHRWSRQQAMMPPGHPHCPWSGGFSATSRPAAGSAPHRAAAAAAYVHGAPRLTRLHLRLRIRPPIARTLCAVVPGAAIRHARALRG